MSIYSPIGTPAYYPQPMSEPLVPFSPGMQIAPPTNQFSMPSPTPLSALSTPVANDKPEPTAPITIGQGIGQGVLCGAALGSASFAALWSGIVAIGVVVMGGRLGQDIKVKDIISGLIKMSVAGAVPGLVLGGAIGGIKASKGQSL